MSTSEVSDVSAVTDTGTDTDEVVVSFQDEALLLGGDPAAIESYLTRRATNLQYAYATAARETIYTSVGIGRRSLQVIAIGLFPSCET